jgi:hypothetical protein
VLAAQLLVAGRAAWQVLAGAVADSPGRSRMHYSGDPFGVWYPVVSWLPEADGDSPGLTRTEEGRLAAS